MLVVLSTFYFIYIEIEQIWLPRSGHLKSQHVAHEPDKTMLMILGQNGRVVKATLKK